MRIINIVPHPPAYQFLGGRRPTISWEQDSGTVIGFDPWEWGDQLAAQIVKLRSNIAYEVWQPDLQASEIHSLTLDNGVVRKLFPAAQHDYKFKFGTEHGWFSDEMMVALDAGSGRGMIVNLNNWRDPFSLMVCERLKTQPGVRLFVSGHGGPATPRAQMRITRNPLKLWALAREQRGIGSYTNRINAISDQNEEILGDLKSLFPEIMTLTMGCDFDFWVPCPSHQKRKEVRERLGITNELAMFSGANLIPRKQLVEFAEVLSGCDSVTPFRFLVAGRGERGYEEQVLSAGRTLGKGRFNLLPYKRDEELRDLYWASDLYVSVASSEGASVAVMQAFATGLPVFSSDAGGTADAMKQWGSNIVVPKYDYTAWKRKLVEVLGGKLPSPVNREMARDRFHWEAVATRFLEIYTALLKAH